MTVISFLVVGGIIEKNILQSLFKKDERGDKFICRNCERGINAFDLDPVLSTSLQRPYYDCTTLSLVITSASLKVC